MAEPWFDPNYFGALWGGLAGGLGGTLAGLLGGLIGTLAPKGKGRMFIFTAMWLFVVAGACSLGLGMYALAVGQPYSIWYGPVLTGVMYMAVMGILLPVVRTRYRQAEQRHLEAEGLRST
jgi:hypothetical protein